MRSFAPLTIALALALVIAGCGSKTEVTHESDAVVDEANDVNRVTTVSFANEKCPIMGGKPDPELVVQWEGKTIGFCCDGCPQKWEKLSDEEKAAKLAAVSHDPAEQADDVSDADQQQQ
jgi:hypothetical protein